MPAVAQTFPIWGVVSLSLIAAAVALPRQMPPPAPEVAVHAAAAVKHSVASAAEAVAAVGRPAAAPTIAIETPAPERTAIQLDSDEVRARLNYEAVRFAGKRVKTLDEESRILLAQAAAQNAGLYKIGLDFTDVYGVIQAETSWIPRTGVGRNGVRSHGLAQFEPGTAKGLGLKNPNDPVDAVFAAAVNIRHGAKWAARKIDHLELTPEERTAKLREGVSVYYNLSVKGRNKWDGVNTAKLPVETRRHIRNVRDGAREAEQLASQLES